MFTRLDHYSHTELLARSRENAANLRIEKARNIRLIKQKARQQHGDELDALLLDSANGDIRSICMQLKTAALENID